MMRSNMNWFGLAGGLTIVVLIAISLFVPWWQLTVGDGLVKANASPINTNFNFAGTSFTIPLIWALNVASIIFLSAGGIAMLVYSVSPSKSYSEKLLGFSYRKPLYAILLFVVVLILITFLVKSVFNFEVPLLGSIETTLPAEITNGTNISVFMSANFVWPFWLAVLATTLCIMAKFYHKKIVASLSKALAVNMPQT
jgi:hypothetical protein